MARGRLISKSLSTSAKFAGLQDDAPKLAEFCQCLYMLLVAHSDDWGRQAGDVFTVKHVIAPASPRSMREVEAAITLLHNSGMIVWYEVDGRKLIQINDFDTHQPGLHKRAEKSKFPEPPDTVGKFPTSTGDSLLREVKLSEFKGTEGKARSRSASVVPLGFDAFWRTYPRHDNRKKAEAAWIQVGAHESEALRAEIYVALEWQIHRPEWTKDNGQYIPHPTSWLNARRWEDEPPKVNPARLSDAGMQSLTGLSAFRERMAAKAAWGEQ